MASERASPRTPTATAMTVLQGRLMSIALLALAVLAVWLALPRFVAGVLAAPHAATIGDLDKVPGLSPAAQDRAQIAYLRALAWQDAPQVHAALGALSLTTSYRAIAANEPSAREDLARSVSEHRAAIGLSPLQPYVWARLVQGELAGGVAPADVQRHLRMAVESAPWEPGLVIARLGLAFVMWDSLDAPTRAAFAEQIRHAARLYPMALARQSRLHRAQDQVLQAIEGDADLLRRFSMAYSRI